MRHRSRKHIAFIYLLLTVFVSGEVVLFTHQHEISKCCGLLFHDVVKKGLHAHKSDTGRCFLCDVIINKKLFLSDELRFISQIEIKYFSDRNIVRRYLDFKKLTQARAPPLTNHSSLLQLI
jgi:hypothetical protein